MDTYSDEVMDHFSNPRNMGEIKDADGVGEVGNLKCGDAMKIFIRVGTRIKKLETRNSKLLPEVATSLQAGETNSNDKNPNIQNGTEAFIEEIKFKTLGCAAAIASSSMTTELARGKSLKDAENISKDDINEALGKLPAPKYHCSILAAEGIKRAIESYRSKNNKYQIANNK